MSLRETVRVAAPLAGGALLVAFAAASVPWSDNPLRRPRTPFDRSASSSVASGFALFRDAAPLIPEGAVLVAMTEPRDPVQETYFHRFALALLPGREVVPAAYYGVTTPPEVWSRAGYVVVVGRRPAQPPGALLLETADGSLWRRAP